MVLLTQLLANNEEGRLIAMESLDAFKHIVNQRRSVRAYLNKPVDQDTLESIFTTAQKAPSNCNTQPWLSAVVSGEKIEQLREMMPNAMLNGEFCMDFPYAGKYDGVYRERQISAANAMYTALGIARDDKPARDGQFFKNFTFFGAPHVVFLFLPACFVNDDNTGIREACDLGMYAQNLMLSMTAHGVASCPQTALSFNADNLRKALDISDDYKLMFGISFGYANEEDPGSLAVTDRAGLSDCVRFYE